MIKWKEYAKNIHNNNIKNEEIGNKRRKQIITKSKKMIEKRYWATINTMNQKKDFRIIIKRLYKWKKNTIKLIIRNKTYQRRKK